MVPILPPTVQCRYVLNHGFSKWRAASDNTLPPLRAQDSFARSLVQGLSYNHSLRTQVHASQYRDLRTWDRTESSCTYPIAVIDCHLLGARCRHLSSKTERPKRELEPAARCQPCGFHQMSLRHARSMPHA